MKYTLKNAVTQIYKQNYTTHLLETFQTLKNQLMDMNITILKKKNESFLVQIIINTVYIQQF